MKPKSFFLLFPLLWVSYGNLYQVTEKREFEQSVKMDQVPGAILDFLDPFLDEARRVKFFKQSDGEKLSWEVKFRYQGRQFSIEFFDDYRLKDIEELVKWNRLEEPVMVPLEDFFETNYKRFRIKRFQKQYLPDNDTDKGAFMRMVLSNPRFSPDGYEIEADVSTKGRGDFGLYEYLFDKNFKMVSKRKIIPVSDGNLLF